MPKPECLSYCPHVTECAEKLFRETQMSAPSDRKVVAAEIDALTSAAARVALAACEGPDVQGRTVQKGGYWGSKKPVQRNVYVCGADGYIQEAAFYHRTDKMPPQ